MSFPGLTRGLFNKFLPPSTATEKGRMIRTQKGLRSTKNLQQEIEDARAQVDGMAPPQQVCTAIDNKMFCFSLTTDYDNNVI